MSRMVSNGTKKAIGVFEIFGHLYLKKRPNAHFYKKNTLTTMCLLYIFKLKTAIKMAKYPLLAHFLNKNDHVKMAYLCGL